MTTDRAVMFFAGTMTLLSVILVWLVSPWWLLLTAFVGANMMQASITGFCPAAMIFEALGTSRASRSRNWRQSRSSAISSSSWKCPPTLSERRSTPYTVKPMRRYSR